MRPASLVPAMLVMALPAWAGSVTVVNGGNETIRQILIAPTPGGGDNRLRSTLPPGAQARITYSTGCQAAVRLVYESGRSEDFASVDPCTEARVTAGAGGTPGPMVAAGSTPRPASASAATPASAKTAATASLPQKAPPPVVPPWTGKSITKRFGGME